jgi:predicted RNA methylase
MNQLTFPWDGPPRPEIARKTVTAVSSQDIARKLVITPNKAVERCRVAADAMEKHIRAKHDSANRMLAHPPTRKRLQDADSIRREAMRLERIQRTLRRLAEMHENCTIAAELASLTSKGAIESALFNATAGSPIHALHKEADNVESTPDRVLRLSREAMLMRIPGFFPTPPAVAEELIEFAHLENATCVLEPSAGTGSLIDAILKSHPRAKISYCEINCFLLDVLRMKYEGLSNVHFAGRDFEELDPQYFNDRFDGIILNPPFERGQDIDHVLRAHRLLGPKGTLAAIVSEGAFCRGDKKAAAFREFIEQTGATVVRLATDSFKSSGTAVQCRFIRIPAQSQRKQNNK